MSGGCALVEAKRTIEDEISPGSVEVNLHWCYTLRG
jgi:hypothetical protein